MGDQSAIEWTDATWNPVIGCEKVSDGCRNCYAIRNAYRLEHAFGHPEYQGLTRRLPDGSLNWTRAVRCLPERLDLPLRWRRPRRIFVNSMADLFHEDVPDDFIERVFVVMAECPQHTFQVLTKRPERMRSLLGSFPPRVRASENVWLGVSVENQEAADERIPLLLQTPAAVRGISAEPLLGPVNLMPFIPHVPVQSQALESPIHWVVAGGESGPGGRWLVERCWCNGSGGVWLEAEQDYAPCPDCQRSGWRPKPEALEWVRSLRDQCQAAGVPFFWKAWGGPTYAAGGRLLDGRTWDEYPQVEDGRG